MLAVITVNSIADDLVGDGMVTLREAIQAANTDTSVDGSVAGSGADTILFDATLFASPQTITLALGELGISETRNLYMSMRIDGVRGAADFQNLGMPCRIHAGVPHTIEVKRPRSGPIPTDARQP